MNLATWMVKFGAAVDDNSVDQYNKITKSNKRKYSIMYTNNS